jgi:membrane-associated phospholipid phosphatase
MAQMNLIAVRQEWHEAWSNVVFRRKVITGMTIVIVIMASFPFFFQKIEQRQGIIMNDPLLRIIPAHNISVPLFIIIWGLSTLAAIRAVQTPRMFLVFAWSWIILSIFRMLTITLVPLDAPAGLIGLVDPLSNFFYGDKFITKDLFFSGHTSTVFLLFLCLPGRKDKKIALLATFCVAILLLVQHVHYTLDVLGGFLFGWISYWIATRKIVRDTGESAL